MANDEMPNLLKEPGQGAGACMTVKWPVSLLR